MLDAVSASIPVIDVREGGSLRHARVCRARAQALRDGCVRWLPLAASGILPAIDAVTRRWLTKSCSPYTNEIGAIAGMLGFSGIWFLNGCYQWGCTALVGERDDEPWLLRTLDWPFPGLGRYVEIARMCGAAGDFYNVTWPGYVGVLSASAPGRFAACMNQAPMRRRTTRAWLRPWDLALNAWQTWGIRHVPPDHLLREVFETCAGYADAKHRLEVTPVARPVIYILAGCRRGERCVIERTENDFVTRTDETSAANDWLPSRPGWEARVAAEAMFTRTGGEAAENSRMRRDYLAGWKESLPAAFDWVMPPVCNSQTRLAVEMCAAKNVLRVTGYEQAEGAEIAKRVVSSEEFSTN